MNHRDPRNTVAPRRATQGARRGRAGSERIDKRIRRGQEEAAQWGFLSRCFLGPATDKASRCRETYSPGPSPLAARTRARTRVFSPSQPDRRREEDGDTERSSRRREPGQMFEEKFAARRYTCIDGVTGRANRSGAVLQLPGLIPGLLRLNLKTCTRLIPRAHEFLASAKRPLGRLFQFNRRLVRCTGNEVAPSKLTLPLRAPDTSGVREYVAPDISASEMSAVLVVLGNDFIKHCCYLGFGKT